MKMRNEYPVDLMEIEDGALMVTFPDLPEGITQGDDRADALNEAQDLLEEMLRSKMAYGEGIPPASPAKGRPVVEVSPTLAAKVELYCAWKESGITKAELARRLGWAPPQVTRLFDVDHNSRIDQLASALRQLGQRLIVGTRPAHR